MAIYMAIYGLYMAYIWLYMAYIWLYMAIYVAYMWPIYGLLSLLRRKPHVSAYFVPKSVENSPYGHFKDGVPMLALVPL